MTLYAISVTTIITTKKQQHSIDEEKLKGDEE